MARELEKEGGGGSQIPTGVTSAVMSAGKCFGFSPLRSCVCLLLSLEILLKALAAAHSPCEPKVDLLTFRLVLILSFILLRIRVVR